MPVPATTDGPETTTLLVFGKAEPASASTTLRSVVEVTQLGGEPTATVVQDLTEKNAPSRAAFCIATQELRPRPKSRAPMQSSKSTGRRRASSTTACPR